MLERIRILARHEAENLLEEGIDSPRRRPEGEARETWAMISIVGWTKTGPAALFKTLDRERLAEKGCLTSLQCCFGDILPPAGSEAGSIPAQYLFSRSEAVRIIAFLEEVKEAAQVLILHCDGGVSRSGAVGLFACRWLGLDETEFFSGNPGISPNPWVLQVLFETAGLGRGDLAYWYKLREQERG
jgi:predicted protein tyrosine phosphatase